MQGVPSIEDLHTRILSHLVLQHHVGHVGDVTDEELLDEYALGEEVEARHILVKEEELALELYERIQSGEDFAELAIEYSEDPGSGQQGGDLGFFKRNAMVPPFEEMSFRLDVGEISEPVRSQHGYHIIQVTNKREFEEDFDEVKENLRNAFNNRKIYKMSEKQKELMSDIEITVNDEQFKSLEEVQTN
nr:peptidylprolyl isomerase [Evansella tamaricis]